MDYKLLYGENVNEIEVTNRIENLISFFKEKEGVAPTHVFSSPGRAEILGNHTDHNAGADSLPPHASRYRGQR